MNLEEAVTARRSVRSFADAPVPREDVEYAVSLAVQAPAPHHSAPWRFVLIAGREDKARFSKAMSEVWRQDLERDRYDRERIEAILERSHALLTSSPLLVVCCADMTRADHYPDERRRRAEWSLFAHSVGAALQVFMLALAERGVASCWISAPVFCGETVKETLGLSAHVEPHALVLAGYPDPADVPRPRPRPAPADFVIG